jgi:hypothetical protein
VTVDRLDTCTGEVRVVVDPSPSAPLLLRPHAHAVPSCFLAREKR